MKDYFPKSACRASILGAVAAAAPWDAENPAALDLGAETIPAQFCYRYSVKKETVCADSIIVIIVIVSSSMQYQIAHAGRNANR